MPTKNTNTDTTTANSREQRIIFKVLEEQCEPTTEGMCRYRDYSCDKDLVDNLIMPQLGYSNPELLARRSSIVKSRLAQVRLDEFGRLVSASGESKKPGQTEERLARLEKGFAALCKEFGLNPSDYL